MKTILITFFMFIGTFSYSQGSDVDVYIVSVVNKTECPYTMRIYDERTGLIIYRDTLPPGYYTIVKPPPRS